MKNARIILTIPMFLTLFVNAENTLPQPNKQIGVQSDIPTSNLKICYVDPYKIIPGLDQWTEERTKLQKEMDTRANQIEELKMNFMKRSNELQNSSSLMTNAAKEAAQEELLRLENSIQIKQKSFQEYAERVTQEAQMNIFKEIEAATKEYALENNIDFVFAGGALYVRETFDISKEITERMNAKYRAKTKSKPAAAVNAPKESASKIVTPPSNR